MVGRRQRDVLGHLDAQITDDIPRIGAVAWWKANHGPAGSAGHVAYVEQVVSADEIIISQDSWGGDFSWAVVTRSSGNWPSGFVHFNDKPLTNTEAPVDHRHRQGRRGAHRHGRQLEAGHRVKVAYQWFADGAPLRKARSATLQLTRARLDQRITVRTTATQLGYPTRSATSAPTEPVLPGQLRNTVAPVISGVSAGRLHAAPSTPAPGTREPTLDIQWYADGQPIDGATGHLPRPRPELVSRVDHRRGHRAPRPATTRSASRRQPTAPVAPGTFTITTAPSLLGPPSSARC